MAKSNTRRKNIETTKSKSKEEMSVDAVGEVAEKEEVKGVNEDGEMGEEEEVMGEGEEGEVEMWEKKEEKEDEVMRVDEDGEEARVEWEKYVKEKGAKEMGPALLLPED